MSIVALTASVPAAKAAQAFIKFSKPVSKPRKSIFKLIGEVLDHGGPGYLQFAITNVCNAKCDFCGFAVDRFDPKQRRSVTLKEAKDVIDIAAKNRIGYLLFVGGEPLVHKELRSMVRYAAEHGIHPFRKQALKKAEQWMLERFEGSDGLAAIFPAMLNSIASTLLPSRSANFSAKGW